jgi:hypothetical protein
MGQRRIIMGKINSKFNEAVAFFANVGVVGKTRTIKFEPVKTKNGKTFEKRTCPHCNRHSAVVFIGFEEKISMLWCDHTSCSRISFPDVKKSTATPAYEGQGRAQQFINKEKPSIKRCAAKTKKGKPCKNNAMKGSKYCGPHQKQHGTTGAKF